MNDRDTIEDFLRRHGYLDDAKLIAARVSERLARYLRRRKQINLSYYVCMGFSQN